jgi:hypothetical protein
LSSLGRLTRSRAAVEGLAEFAPLPQRSREVQAQSV